MVRRRKLRDDTCTKGYAVFKCQSEECGKSWQSYHGWSVASSFKEACLNDGCPGEGKIVNLEEGMTVVDVYVCPKDRCGKNWQVISMNAAGLNTCTNCTGCRLLVVRSGQQERMTKRVSFECKVKTCKRNWTSPYFGAAYTQKCRHCHNRGVIIGGKEIEDAEEEKENKPGSGLQRRFYGPGGRHNISGCDMCQSLLDRGLAESCINSNYVKIDEIQLEDGRIVQNYSATFRNQNRFRRPPRCAKEGVSKDSKGTTRKNIEGQKPVSASHKNAGIISANVADSQLRPTTDEKHGNIKRDLVMQKETRKANVTKKEEKLVVESNLVRGGASERDRKVINGTASVAMALTAAGVSTLLGVQEAKKRRKKSQRSQNKKSELNGRPGNVDTKKDVIERALECVTLGLVKLAM